MIRSRLTVCVGRKALPHPLPYRVVTLLSIVHPAGPLLTASRYGHDGLDGAAGTSSGPGFPGGFRGGFPGGGGGHHSGFHGGFVDPFEIFRAFFGDESPFDSTSL